MKLYYETVSENMLKTLRQLMEIDELSAFRLVGGTSLAMQFGHRTSVDLDLFAGGYVDITKLLETVRNNFRTDFTLVTKSQNGISGVIKNIKVDLYDWKVPFAENPLLIDGIRLATPADIFAYKCEAILDRKSEKDFSDIAEISGHYELGTLLTTLKLRYPYISTGSIFSILAKKESIVRDKTIRYSQNNSFEKYATVLREKLTAYEQNLQDQKKIKEEERASRIQSLIEKKKSGK